jgi:hypothetical protein
MTPPTETLLNLRDSPQEIKKESHANGVLPHYCITLRHEDNKTTYSKLHFEDKEPILDDYHVYHTSKNFDARWNAGEPIHVLTVSTGIRKPSFVREWSLLQLGLQCREPDDAEATVDLSLWIVFPACWSKKMYCAALHSSIFMDESHLFRIHSNCNFGNASPPLYSICNVHALFVYPHKIFHEDLRPFLQMAEVGRGAKFLQCGCQFQGKRKCK